MKSGGKRKKSAARTKTVSPFTLLIKPAGPDCNLRCSYCFYLPKQALFPPSAGERLEEEREGGAPRSFHRMSDEVLELLIRSYLQTPQPHYVFNWQGGEPTLMGLDFFRRAVELQRKYAPAGASVTNTLQTNGTLIDGEWARFLAEHSFLTGVSLDGPAEIHDAYRRDSSGQGSFSRVMGGIEQLRSSGAEFNILTMVTSRSAAEAGGIWAFFRKERFRYQQYIPCVEFDSRDQPLPYTVSGEEWGRFLLDIFKAWYPRDVRRVSVRNFDTIINFLAAGEYHSCTMRGTCDAYFVVEHDGGVYPCDFFVEPRYRLGTVQESSWAELQSSPLYRGFGAQKSRWNAACGSCEYLDYCSGDCLKMRLRSERDPQRISWLCRGHHLFLRETLPRFTELARQAREQVLGLEGNTELPPVSREPAEACFCGSGKKHRNCHMQPRIGALP
jgi:uncharacterized protein